MEAMTLTHFSFLVLGITSCILTGFLITRRWPVSAAMLLIAIFVCVAGMFGLLEAHFAAVMQLIVYAGAIMVVFIFVIMLLNLPPEELRFGRVTLTEWILTGVGVLIALWFGTHVGQGYLAQVAATVAPEIPRVPFYPEAENVRNVSAHMFTDFLWSFEITSVLMIAAMVGAVVVAKKRSSDVKPT